MSRLPEHTSAEWIAALRGEGHSSSAMVVELEAYVRRILGTTLRRRALSEDQLDEMTQEAFSQLLGRLATFRGDSAFPTWAAAVATRVAFTQLRRQAAIQEKHESFRQAEQDALASGSESASSSPASGVLDALRAAIATDLTEKQRIATLALLRGVPTIEIAERTNSNQNAVYKLVHDARLRLRARLEAQGVTGDDILASMDGGQRT